MLVYSLEDDVDIALIINKALTKQGFDVHTFYNGNDFLKAFNQEKPQIVLLDLMLPDISGLDILRTIRKNSENEDIHIIIISAKHLPMDKVEGLDLGADDYVEKPFDVLELMSRVEAHARRLRQKSNITYKDITLDLNKRECHIGEEKIILTNKEFEILSLLLKNPENVVTREELFKCIWDTDKIVESRTLDMHIKSLRNKLGDKGQMIKSIYGVGYKVSLWRKN